MVENYGKGIERTIESYENFDKKPEFNTTENFFYVTLYNMNYSPDKINDKINDLGLKILRLINSNPGIKVPDIFNTLQNEDKSITLDMIRNQIYRELQDYIVFKGSRKTGGYYIK